MEERLHAMLDDYDHGRLTRRQLISRLSGFVALAGGAGALAAEGLQSPSTFQAIGLNHIALTVTDIRRSREFYVRHLGLAVERESGGSCFLTFGGDFLALFRGENAGLDHYCYSIKDFSLDRAADRLRKQGIEPRIQGERIYFDDPDGLEVQLASEHHRA